MSDITQTIKDKLSEIERTENVRILYACESGSRAWGFASEDSDYDVRFVYVRPLEFYLRLDKTNDMIEYEQNEVYDINGWDLRKLLQLTAKSNPTIYEWADSPIVYRTSDDWETVKALLDDYYILEKMLHHYVSMTRHNIRMHFQGDDVMLKKYFYILRPILACEWVMTKRCPPPTDFHRLREAVLPKELDRSVDKLLDAKTNSTEKQTGHHLEDLDHYIHNKIAETEFFLANEGADKRKVDWEKLNDVFLKVVNKPKPTILKNWRVVEFVRFGITYKIATGIVYNHKRLYDGDDISTSSIESIKIDHENEAIFIQTRNTLYTCSLKECYFLGQDKYPDAVPDYQKIREKYYDGSFDVDSEDGKLILVISDMEAYYFYSMLGKINGEEIIFETTSHIGSFVDTFLIENSECGIDIRYYVHDGLIEFYSTETNGLELFVHNVGNGTIYVKNADEDSPIKSNERIEIKHCTDSYNEDDK